MIRQKGRRKMKRGERKDWSCQLIKFLLAPREAVYIYTSVVGDWWR